MEPVGAMLTVAVVVWVGKEEGSMTGKRVKVVIESQPLLCSRVQEEEPSITLPLKASN